MLISILGFVFMVGFIIGSLYFVDSKTFKDNLGMVVIYFGGMFTFFGILWFSVITPSINKIGELSISEQNEIGIFLNYAILTMIIISFLVIIITNISVWYLDKKEEKVCHKE